MDEIAQYIDHTLLKPDASFEAYLQLCQEADQYHFHSVCVSSSWVPFIKKHLKGPSKICSAIGFPHGNNSTLSKLIEAGNALSNGATEIDTVLNIGALKSKDYDSIKTELNALKDLLQKNILKVILEVGLLTDEEVKKACELCIESKCDFVKTSTGFNHIHSEQDTINHAKLLLQNVQGTPVKVKASSFIRTLVGVQELIRLGVARIGCSKSVQIVNNLQATKIKGDTT